MIKKKKKEQHIHRYERAVIGKNNYTVYRCNLPDCMHYIAARLAKDKQSLCNRCGDIMVLDKRAMNLEKPHCINCIQTKKKEGHDSIAAFLEEIDSMDVHS